MGCADSYKCTNPKCGYEATISGGGKDFEFWMGGPTTLRARCAEGGEIWQGAGGSENSSLPASPGRDEGTFYFVPKIKVITPTRDAPNMIPQQNTHG